MMPSGETRSGDEAIAAADTRAAATRDVNIANAPAPPITADTANVRQGPEIHEACLALLPLVGIWRGTGMFGNDPSDGTPQFGQQVTFAHDGRPFLRYESISWLLATDGSVTGPGERELGWLRPQSGPQSSPPSGTQQGAQESAPEGPASGTQPAGNALELLVAHAEGRLEVFYGQAQTLTSWALSTDGVLRTPSSRVPVTGASRLYGITADGRLAYVEERAHDDVALAPHASAILQRIAG